MDAVNASLPSRVLRLERQLRALSAVLVLVLALLLVAWVQPEHPQDDVIEAGEFRLISPDGEMLGWMTAVEGFPQIILTASDESEAIAINAGDVIIESSDGDVLIGHSEDGPHLFMMAPERQPRLALRADQAGAQVRLRGSGGSEYVVEANNTSGSLQFRGPEGSLWASLATEASGQRLTLLDKHGGRYVVLGFMTEDDKDVPVNFLTNEVGEVMWDGYGTIPDEYEPTNESERSQSGY